MIDTKKVQLMTKITTYEKSKGGKDLRMNRYSKKAYLALKLLDLWISVTAVCAMISVLYAAYLVMLVVNTAVRLDYGRMTQTALALYLSVMIIATVIAVFCFSRRYDAMKKNIGKYEKDLTDLKALVSNEEKIVLFGQVEVPPEIAADSRKE